MSLFRYARDHYVDETAQQLLPAAGWLLLSLVGLFIAVHLIRRSAGHPVANAPATALPPHASVVRYEIGARLYHWGNALLVLGLGFSGVALFAPGRGERHRGSWSTKRSRSPSSSFRPAHRRGASPRRGAIDVVRGEDARDLRLIAANFLGRTRNYPAIGKYDPLQKLYHAFLTLLAAGMIFSGICLLLSAEAWTTFSHAWMRLCAWCIDWRVRVHRDSRRPRLLRHHSRELAAAGVDVDRTTSRLELQPVSRRRSLAAANER